MICLIQSSIGGFTSTGGKPVNRSFAEKLAAATNEDKQVNPIYVQAISKGLKKENASMDADRPVYSGYTDGLFECSYYGENGDVPFLLQLECKQDVDLNDSEQFAKVMLQVFYYIKQFDRAKERLPKVIVLGTKINCLTIAKDSFFDDYIKGQSYPETDERGNKISASTAPFNPLYQPLLRRIRDDAALHTKFRVIEVTDKNAVSELCKDIVKLAKDIGLKEDIDVKTLVRAFEFFDLKVLSEKSRKQDTRVKVGAFMQLILNPRLVQADMRVDALGNRSYSDTFNFNGTVLTVDPNKYNSFANLFAMKNRQLIEQKSLTAVQDMLIEDISRRRKGDFYTPSIWVDEAHKLMDKNLGPNWRKESIVWDCAWGTGNLTRDYDDFGSLYCSTLYEEDIKTGALYNPFKAKFQYDFLNDDVQLFEIAADALWAPFVGTRFYKSDLIKDKVNFKDIADIYTQAVEAGVTTEEKCQAALADAIGLLHTSKLHLSTFNASGTGKSLVDELLANSTAGEASKPLVFFINPPYGAATNRKNKAGYGDTEEAKAKTAVANTFTKDIMALDGAGAATQNLYTQFMYRIHRIGKMFGTKCALGLFCPSAIYTGASFEKLRKLLGGWWFTDGFLISAGEFSGAQANWGITFGVIKDTPDTGEITVHVAELSSGDVEYHDKIIAAIDDSKRASVWVREPVKHLKVADAPQMTSALKWNYTPNRGKLVPGALGYGVFGGNIVDENGSGVFLLTSTRSTANGVSIMPENFDRVVSYHAARRLITGQYATWINCKDEYMIPNTEHPDYAQWQADCIVHSLFNTASNQSSLRNIDYNGKTWNIFNEFFWLGRDQMYTLASTVANNEIMQDLLTYAKSGDRFVYKKLQTVSLSDDAKLVLDMATAILIDTMKYREEFDRKHPEYHINSWDAGWYQVKAVAKEYIPDKLKLFNELYKKLEDRMRPLVYELGFLYK